jgi:hypothetical protein
VNPTLENCKEKWPDVCKKCCEKKNAEHTTFLYCLLSVEMAVSGKHFDMFSD